MSARDDARILVVEDNRALRRGIALALRETWSEVDEAESGDEALNRIRDGASEPYDVIVTDVRLPGADGVAVLRAARKRDSRTSVLLTTAYGTIEAAVQAMKAGAVDFLQKPVNDQQLLDSIHRALSKDRKKRSQKAREVAVRGRYEILTPREQEVLSLVVSGLKNKEIADEMGASERTVKVHRARVMEKMKAVSLPHLVRLSEMLDLN